MNTPTFIKHQSIKYSLKNILNQYGTYHPLIENTVYRTNSLVHYGYQFLRYIVLNHYQRKGTHIVDFSFIDKSFIYNVLSYIGTKKKVKINITKVDKKIKQEKKDIRDDIINTYGPSFCNINNLNIDSSNLSAIMTYCSVEMLTCLENNIINHFKDYLNRYINVLFVESEKDKIKHLPKNEQKQHLSDIRNELKQLKIALYSNGTYNGTYKIWFNNNKKLLVPDNILENNINYHLKVNPLLFLSYAIYINTQIESLKFRPFQIIPQRNNNVPCFITLDSAALVDNLFNNKTKDKNFTDDLIPYINEYNLLKPAYNLTLDTINKTIISDNPSIFRDYIFNLVLKQKYLKHNNKYFNHIIKTDGVSIVLDFVNIKVKRFVKGIKPLKPMPDITIHDNFKYKEDNYYSLDTLKPNEINDIKENYVLLGLDPGKKDLVTIVDNNTRSKVFKYNSLQRRHETYMRQRQLNLEEELNKHQYIKNANENLTKYSCRTLNINNYVSFIQAKHNANIIVDEYYKRKFHRKYKFTVYCRTKQSEMNMLNNIEKTFKVDNKKICIAYGNWSQNLQMKNYFSTPNKWLRQLISKRFMTITTDEFKTSCMYCLGDTKTQLSKPHIDVNNTTKLVNMYYLKVKDGVMKPTKCHKVLIHRYTNHSTGKQQGIFIDRDINGAKNILKCLVNKINGQERPYYLRRTKNSVYVPSTNHI